MTMTLDDVLEQSGVMLGDGKLPTADQLIAWREAIALHLAGMGEPAAWMTICKCVGHDYGKKRFDGMPIQSLQPGYYEHVPLYTAPPINLAAVREVIASLYAPGHPVMTAAADKLEAAIATQTKEPRS